MKTRNHETHNGMKLTDSGYIGAFDWIGYEFIRLIMSLIADCDLGQWLDGIMPALDGVRET